MPARRPRSWFRLAPLVLGMLVLAGLAPPTDHSDNFNNNVLAGARWRTRTFGQAGVSEVNKRLEFFATGPTSPLSAAGVQFKPYGIDWTQDFHIEWKGRLNLPTVTGNRKVFFGTLLVIDGQFPQSMTGLGCGYYRDATGLYFGFLEFTNGQITNLVGTVTPIATNARARIDWIKSVDRISIIQDDLSDQPTAGPYVPLFGFFDRYGDDYGDLPMKIYQGLLMIGSNINVTGARANIDNWSATFAPRDFP